MTMSPPARWVRAKCPDCGRENVLEPMGYVTLCGRRVYHVPSEDWRERMRVANRCREVGELRKQAEIEEQRERDFNRIPTPYEDR